MKLHFTTSLEHSEHMCLWSQAKLEKDADKMQTGEIAKESLETFLEDLVKVNSVVNKHETEQPFAGTSVFLVHHLTREVLGTIQALRKLGCKDINCQFLGYNADAAKIFGPFLNEVPDTELRTYKLAVDANDVYSIDRAFTKPSDALPADSLDAAIEGKDYLTCQRSLASFVTMEMFARCEASETPLKMIVIEDGGYMAPLLNDSALRKLTIASFRKENSVAEDNATDSKLANYSDMGELVDKHLAGTVEHTRNGYDQIQKTFLKHGKLAKPCFTIALSYTKTQFEALSVADTCINSLSNALFSHGRTLRERNICVIGSRGNIGGRSVQAFSSRVNDAIKQVVGVDIKVGFSSSEQRPTWEPSPYEAVREDLLESRKFKDLPVDVRRKVDVVFGITGGRQENPDGGFDETLVPEDIDFWLREGESKYNELWLVSGSTKTKEFELVKDFVEGAVKEGQYKEYAVASVDLADPLSKRDYGQLYTFTSSSGKVKSLIAVTDWKPANFMFYGVPTEDIDVILAQLVDVSVALLNNLDAPCEVNAVDYTPIATHGIIEAIVDPLPNKITVPSPPDTQAALDALTSVWKLGQNYQLGQEQGEAPTLVRVVDWSKDKWDELKEEGIAFDCYEDIVQATNEDLSIANTIFAVGVTSGYHSLTVLEIQLILSGSGIVELDGDKTPFKSGDRIIVPAGVKQRHVNTGTVPIEMLCVCTPAFSIKDFTGFEKPIIDTAFAEKAKGIVATIPYFGLQQQQNETLKGKTAVVTGAASEGMGKELCRQLGRMGCRVMLTDRDPSKTDAAVQELKAEGLDVFGTAVDVTSDKDISNLVTACENQFCGKVDILINNAGVNFDETEMSDLDKATRTMDINFYGPIRLTDALTSALIQTNGRVINISTELAESYYKDDGPPLPYPMFPIYKSSKQALNNWSREKAVDLEKKGISLNVVNPGWVQTPMGGGNAPDTLLDGVQATLYLSTTDNSHPGEFFQPYTVEKVPAGMVKVCTISW